MHDQKGRSLAADFAHDLQQAAGVGSRYEPGARREDILQLAAADSVGHAGLVEDVNAGRAAEDFRFLQVAEFQAGIRTIRPTTRAILNCREKAWEFAYLPAASGETDHLPVTGSQVKSPAGRG